MSKKSISQDREAYLSTVRSAMRKLSAQEIISFPLTKDKKPRREVPSSAPSHSTIRNDFSDYREELLAIRTGECSNGVQGIDIDAKHDIDGTLWKKFIAELKQHAALMIDKLVIQQTPAGGKHLLFRCEVSAPSQILAGRAANEVERSALPDQHHKPLIELKGEGGYMVVSPSHDYVILQGSLSTIQKISIVEYDTLLAVCMSFDLMAKGTRFHPVAANPLTINRIIYGDFDWSKYQTTPWQDFNNRGDVPAMLRLRGWVNVTTEKVFEDRILSKMCLIQGQKPLSAEFSHVDRKLTVFTQNNQLPTNIPLTPFEVFCLVDTGGSIKNAVKKLLVHHYGRIHGKSLVPVLPYQRGVPLLTRRDVEEGIKGTFTKIETFWHIKNIKSQRMTIEVHDKKYINWLNSWGLYLYPKSIDKKTPYVLVKNNVAQEVDMKYIKDATKSYVASLPDEFDGIRRDDLENVIMRGVNKFFSDKYLEFLPLYEKPMLSDSATVSYIPFQNGVLKIDEEGFIMLSYADIDHAVWRSHIIKHDFSPDPFQGGTAVFSKFLSCVVNHHANRYLAAVTIIGYLLHTYKDKSRPFAISFMDEKDAGDNPEGGTGKGLIIQAIQKIRKVVILDGKKKDLMNKSFALQRVRPDTDIVAIQDADRSFDFESIFNIITEGITVEQKFGTENYIPYEDSPKFIINTNYTLKGDSSSHRRRKVIMELYPYFSDTYSPIDEFGHRFFDDWDWNEWNKFYNFMAYCLFLYMKEGIKKTDIISARLRTLKESTSEDFVAWWLSKFPAERSDAPFPRTTFEKNVLHKDYLDYAQLNDINFPMAKMALWVQKGCQYSYLTWKSQEVKTKGVRVMAWIIEQELKKPQGEDQDHFVSLNLKEEKVVKSLVRQREVVEREPEISEQEIDQHTPSDEEPTEIITGYAPDDEVM